MIPRILHQIWPGTDPLPERLAYLLARNAKYCSDHGYQHWFWRIGETGALLLKTSATQYSVVDLSKKADPRMFALRSAWRMA